MAKLNRADLAWLGEQLEVGATRPVVDRRYGLSEIADAFRYLEEGHARGKIVVTVPYARSSRRRRSRSAARG